MVAAAPDVLSPLSLILESVLKADQQMMERTKTKILSALISVLQIQGLHGQTCFCQLIFNSRCPFVRLTVEFFCPPGGDNSQLPQLLLSVCETVKDEVLILTDISGHLNQCEGAEDEDSMETDSPRSSQKDQRDGVSRLQNRSKTMLSGTHTTVGVQREVTLVFEAFYTHISSFN